MWLLGFTSQSPKPQVVWQKMGNDFLLICSYFLVNIGKKNTWITLLVSLFDRRKLWCIKSPNSFDALTLGLHWIVVSWWHCNVHFCFICHPLVPLQTKRVLQCLGMSAVLGTKLNNYLSNYFYKSTTIPRPAVTLSLRVCESETEDCSILFCWRICLLLIIKVITFATS